MWQRLGGLREAVAEGLQEFKRDALKETSLLKGTVAAKVGPVAAVATTALSPGTLGFGKGKSIVSKESHSDSSNNEEFESKTKLMSTDLSVGNDDEKVDDNDKKDISDELKSPSSFSSETIQPDSARSGWVTLDLAGDDDATSQNVTSELTNFIERTSSINGQRWQMNDPHSSSSLSFEGMTFPSVLREYGNDNNGDGDGEGDDDGDDTNESEFISSDSSKGPFLPLINSNLKAEEEAGRGKGIEGEGEEEEKEKGGREGEAQSSSVFSKSIHDQFLSPPTTHYSNEKNDANDGHLLEEIEVDLTQSSSQNDDNIQNNDNVNSNSILNDNDDANDDDYNDDVIIDNADKSSNNNAFNMELSIKEKEIKRLNNVCSELQSSLSKILFEKEKWTVEMNAVRNKLQSTESQNLKLMDEIEESNSKLIQIQKKGKEDMDSNDEEVEELMKQINNLENKISEKEKIISMAKKDHENFEQKVIAMTRTLEKRMEGLTSELQSRQNRIMNLEEENESMTNAFSELKDLMKKAIQEREEAMDSALETEKLLKEFQTSLSKAEAEAESSRKEALERSVAIAKANAEIFALRESSKANDLGEEEKRRLEEALEAMDAASQASSAELSAMTEKCQKLEREGKDLTQSLGLAEAELDLARQRIQEAEVQAEEATRLMQKAVGTSEELKEQSERRAKIFNAAVKAAVTKIQTELEEARDSALERVSVLESENQFHISELKKMKLHVNDLNEKIISFQNKEEELNIEIDGSKSNLERVAKEREDAYAKTEDALKQLHAIQEVTDSMTLKSATMQSRISELEEEISSKERMIKDMNHHHQSSLNQIQEKINAYEKEKMTESEANVHAGKEISVLESKIAELESKLVISENRALRHTALATAKRAGASLADLGLDSFREERLRFKDRVSPDSSVFDIEASVDSRLRSKSKKEVNVGQSGVKRSMFDDNEKMLGRISMRSFILVIYIMVLHIMVMVSFTQRSIPACVENGLGDDHRTVLQNL